jgi:hypothetical protein
MALLAELAARANLPDLLKTQEQLADPGFRDLAAWAGVDLAGIHDLARSVREGALAVMRASALLPPYGWAVVPNTPTMTNYVDAVRLIDAGAGSEAIDEHMTAAWNSGSWLNRSYKMLYQLVGPTDEDFEHMTARRNLLHEAWRHHDAGQYAASILIVLSQMDGLTAEVFGPKRSAFSGLKGYDFEDDRSVAGMPLNLRVVWKLTARSLPRTRQTGEFRRNAIVHGQELAYATKTNSTKAFVLLRAMLEWMQPIAKARAAAADGSDVASTSG